MAYLLDSNILLRWAQPHAVEYPLVIAAVEHVREAGETVYITSQNLIEFWAVATRPISVNGLNMSPERAEQELTRFESLFLMLPDIPAIYSAWRHLVVLAGVAGRHTHDARLAAVMRAHGITHLLTFNDHDFTAFPGITVVHPRDVPPATSEEAEQA